MVESTNTSQTNGGFPGGSVVKNLPAGAGDESSIPGLGRSPGKGNGNPPQHLCLGNPMDREAWWATVHWVAKEPDTTDRLKPTNNNKYYTVLKSDTCGPFLMMWGNF